MTAQKSAPKKPHHHGNLHDTLVEAGIELLEDGGMTALSLRKCAARAGVSHAAPAHHFDGLEGLKLAIAQEAFRRFSAAMLAARDSGPQDPHGRLKSICRGYLHFGQRHPGLLQLIFGVDPHEMTAKTRSEPGENAYRILAECCAPFVPAGDDPRIVETQVWALAHGFTLLALPGRFAEDGVDHSERLFDQVLTLLDHLGQTPGS